MSRTITLIRHAKSDWGHPDLSDFDRPLNERGEQDAPHMGEVLMQRGVQFDRVIASPANRAITTAIAICNAVGYDKERIDREINLYLASASEIIHELRKVDDRFQRVAVVCHNPGLTALANLLGDMKIDNMPTCSVAIFETDIESWDKLEPGCCRSVDFLQPKGI